MQYASSTQSLYGVNGQRLYINAVERNAFLDAAKAHPPIIETFCQLLTYTGCRVSEGLALTKARIDPSECVVVFETLKRRRRGMYRGVPIPPAAMSLLCRVHGIGMPHGEYAEAWGATPLWGMSRSTAYRKIKLIMIEAGIAPGPYLCPKGLRHGFGVACALAGVPPGKLSQWMGHAKLDTSAIYANAVGAEERALVDGVWVASSELMSSPAIPPLQKTPRARTNVNRGTSDSAVAAQIGKSVAILDTLE